MEVYQDPQVEEILIRFHNLRSKQSRRAVYLNLLSDLRVDEKRELKNHIDKNSFHRDILGSLPLEIAAQITSHLEIADLFNFQSVCKRWKSIFTNRLVRDSVINWRHGHETVDTSSNLAFTLFARERVMLERGLPVSQSHFSWQLQIYRINMNPMDYSNGRYAWVEMDTFVFVRHLRTGALQRFCTENRDIFDNIRITDQIVAALSRRGTCHVWNLHNGTSGVFHLPSANFNKFIANGTKVAFGFRENVLQWDLTTQATHAIRVPTGLHLIILHPTQDRLATVHISNRDTGRFAGSIPTDRAQFTLRRFARTPSGSSGCSTGPYQPCDPNDSPEILPLPSDIGPGGNFYEDLTDRKSRCNHRLGSVHINWHNNRDLTEALILTADPLTFHIYMHRTHPGSIHNVGLSMAAIAPDLLYYIRNVDGNPTIWISNPRARRAHRPCPVLSRELFRREVAWEEFDRRFMILGDGCSVLLVDSSGLRVWSFDREAQAVGAIPVS